MDRNSAGGACPAVTSEALPPAPYMVLLPRPPCPLGHLLVGEANTLFRSNSLASKSMESFLKVRSQEKSTLSLQRGQETKLDPAHSPRGP